MEVSVIQISHKVSLQKQSQEHNSHTSNKQRFQAPTFP